ncbi:hypothetical protein HPB51_014470 [Rhipicephalus microplus]|uniref:Uncharacterized protein n=1 Tax=Rhipicephalus microplus TaxID=6941 RepID=A0A9J6EAA1_RHIMP|nr:hypothetical protein HPB51_014470 [Rhipicephalus microplus]
MDRGVQSISRIVLTGRNNSDSQEVRNPHTVRGEICSKAFVLGDRFAARNYERRRERRPPEVEANRQEPPRLHCYAGLQGANGGVPPPVTSVVVRTVKWPAFTVVRCVQMIILNLANFEGNRVQFGTNAVRASGNKIAEGTNEQPLQTKHSPGPTDTTVLDETEDGELLKREKKENVAAATTKSKQASRGERQRMHKVMGAEEAAGLPLTSSAWLAYYAVWLGRAPPHASVPACVRILRTLVRTHFACGHWPSERLEDSSGVMLVRALTGIWERGDIGKEGGGDVRD